MLAVLQLAAAVLWGVLLTTRLSLPLRAHERLALGNVLGLTLVLWLPLLFALMPGIGTGAAGVTTASQGAVFASLVLAAWELHVNRRGRERLGADAKGFAQALRNRGAGSRLILALMILGGLLTYLVHNHFFRVGPGGSLFSAGTTWGDLTLHASLASAFFERGNLHPPEYPFFAGWPLAYPFVSDFSVASFRSLGLTPREAFALGAWVSISVFGLMSFALARRLTDDAPRSAAYLALALFLLSGGLGFALFFQDLWAGTSIQAALKTNYTYGNADPLLAYANVIGNQFLASRSAPYGMAIGVAVLWLLTTASRHNDETFGLALAGALLGSLPLVHSHSFLGVGLASVFYAWADLRRNGRAVRRRWLWFGAFSTLLALPQLVWIWQHLSLAPSHLRLLAGWPRSAETPLDWLHFWIWNAAPFLLLVPIAWWKAPRHLRWASGPLVALFPLANLVTVTPLAYENIKLLAYFQLGGAILVGRWLGVWFDTGRRKWAPALLTLTMCLSGALAVTHEVLGNSVMLSHEEVRVGEFVRDQTPVDAVFLTGSDMHHPVPMLSGRQIVLGSKRWLYNHGIPFEQRATDVARMFEGDAETADLLDRYEVDYVVIGPREHAEFPALDETHFERNAQATARLGSHTIYRLSRRARPEPNQLIR
ncbi:hypothetical protein MK489_18625 [Myxococcota bacterium]|nr:hypothetical protein [Myxococcota bacterium]